MNATNLTGNYSSQVFDSGSFALWQNITWTTDIPYGQNLPSSQSVESSSTVPGGANMTGNTLLWNLDDTSLTSVTDSSGNSNTASETGANLIQGKIGYAHDFAGSTTNQYINKTTVSNFPTSTLTTEMWVKSQNGNTNQGILSYAVSGSTDELTIYAQQSLTIYINGISTNTGVNIADGLFHHVVVTWQSSNGNLTLYKDGLQAYSATVSTGTPIATAGSLVIAQRQTTVGGGFNALTAFKGAIDQIAIYNRTLSATEILNHYKRSSIQINPFVRACETSNCANYNYLPINSTIPQDTTYLLSRYFQFKFNFETDNASYTPTLNNVTTTYTTRASSDGDALIAYTEAAATPRYRTYNWNGTLSSELNAANMGNSDPDWLEIAKGPNSKAILGVIDSAEDVNVQIWDGATWGNNLEVTATSRRADHSMDVAYEANSSKALIVYNNRQNTPKYRVWNGTTWGSEDTIPSVTAEPEAIRLKAKPNSNEILFITRTSNGRIALDEWDGTGWNHRSSVSFGSSLADIPIALSYEAQSGRGIAVWGDLDDPTPNYQIWSGTAWSASANAQSIGAATRDPLYLQMDYNPLNTSNQSILVTISDNSSIAAQVWNGTGWNNLTGLTATGCNNALCADVAYESQSSKALVVYSDGSTTLKYKIWSGTSFGVQQSVATLAAVPNSIKLTSHPNRNELTLVTQDASGNVNLLIWNSTAWVSQGSIGTGATPATRRGIAAVYTIGSNSIPVIQNISTTNYTYAVSSTINLTINGISDANSNTLQLACAYNTTPTTTGTICTSGTTSSSTPYNLNCGFNTSTTNLNYTVYCRAYDGSDYSSLISTTFQIDSTVPSTTLTSVAGDTTAPYYDNANDGQTNILVEGENSMQCRYNTTDITYSSMPSANQCTVTSSTANCSITLTQGTYNYYISCKDAAGNEQNSTTNIDATSIIVDWTAPTTTDSSVSDIKVPPYSTTITESDNVDSDPTTQYCKDTVDTCTPNTTIDNAGTVTFTSSNRGTNYFKFNSTDDARNNQLIQNKTININRLPVLTSTADNATTIAASKTIQIQTNSTDADSDLGQIIKLYICSTAASTANGCNATTLCSNTSAIANATCSFTSTDITGDYNWYAYLYDELNESATANPQSGAYSVDASGPSITVNFPQNTTYTQSSVSVIITTNETTDTAWYSLDGAANQSLGLVTSTQFETTLTNLSNGAHNITFYANDSLGNIGPSNTTYFTISITISDTTPPSIILLAPLNATYSVNYTQVIISTNENTSTALYSVNNTSNVTLTRLSDTLFTGNITDLNDAAYNITIYANDTSGNLNSTTLYFTIDAFTLDTTPPQITLVSPINLTYITNNLTITVSTNENTSTASYSLNGTTNITLNRVSDTLFNATLTNLPDGLYNITIYANDTSANLNNTTPTYFTVNTITPDTTPPTISFINPTNTTYAVNYTAVTISTNENTSTVLYSINDTANVSMTRVTDTLFTGNVTSLNDATYNITIYANDTTGNLNSTTLYFTIDAFTPDTTPPQITLISPTNTTYSISTISIILSTDENTSSALYSINNSANTTLSRITDSLFNTSITDLPDGPYNLTVYTNDTTGNWNSTLIFFTINTIAPDNTAPDISIIAPTNTTLSTNTTQLLVGLNENASTVLYSLDDAANVSLARILDTLFNSTLSNLPDGAHNVTIYANDTSGNLNSTTRWFTITTLDTIPPQITIASPQNTTYTVNSIGISIATNENASTVLYSINNSANSTLNRTTDFLFSATINNQTDADYNITIYANDTSGNLNSTTQYYKINTTTQDTTPPIISILSPLNTTIQTSYTNILIGLNENATNVLASIDGAANVSLTRILDSLFNTSASSLNDGLHNVTIYANDTSGNLNSSIIWFTVNASDLTAPQINVASPQNTTYYASTISVSVATNENASTVLYSLDGASNSTLTRITDTLFTATLSSLSDGAHNITIYANDTNNNLNNTPTIHFTISINAPVITIVSPTFASTYNTPITLNITLNENASNAWYSLDGAANVTLSNTTKTNWNATITPAQGIHSIIFYANDTTGLESTSNNYTFTYDTQAPQYTSATYSPASPNETTNLTCISTWTDNVALSTGIIQENSSGVNTNHTINISATAGQLNYSLNVTPSTVNCTFYANDTTGNLNSTTLQIQVTDATPPVIRAVTNAPNTSAALDPNTQINITANVTDNYQIDSVILQYKEHNDTNYTNTTMQLSAGLYIANFTPNTQNNWTYRIIANDTTGNTQNSAETNLTIENDQTYTIQNTIPQVKSIIFTEPRNITLGNITITNTGDVTLNFTFPPNNTWLDINDTLLNQQNYTVNATLAPGQTAQINATALAFDFPVALYSYQLNITASNTTNNISTTQINGSINIQNTPGPYLALNIVEYSSVVTAGQTDITLTAQVQNLGTAAATNAWLAWTLPSQFTLQTGQLNRTYATIPAGTTANNTITITVNENATNTTVTINATANATEETSSTDTKTITIGTPITTTETQTITTGGGASGSGSGSGGAFTSLANLLQGEKVIQSNDLVVIQIGRDTQFNITIKNIFQTATITNLTIQSQGWLSNYLTFQPDTINAINPNQDTQISALINAPEYLQKGTYELNVILKGKITDKTATQTFIENRRIKIIVNLVNQTTAQTQIQNAQDAIKQLQEQKLLVLKAQDKLNLALNYYQAYLYDDAYANALEITQMQQQAQEVTQRIQKIADIIGTPNLIAQIIGISRQYSATNEHIALAYAAMAREDYKSALEYMSQAEVSLALEKTQTTPILYTIENWNQILIAIIALATIAYLLRRRLIQISIQLRLDYLNQKENTIIQAIKDTQKSGYQDGSISAGQLKQKLHSYEKQLAKIRKERTTLRYSRALISNKEEQLKTLKQQEQNTTQQLKQLQDKYYNQRQMPSNEYEIQQKSYDEQLAEIKTEIQALKNRGDKK